MNRLLLAALVGTLTLSACDSNDPDPVAIEAQVATDVAADPGVRDPNTGQVASTGRYTLFDLDAGTVVLDYTETDRADSLGTAWDIGFNGTSIIVNGGPGRAGDAAAQVLGENGTTPVAFEDLTEAPADGYRQDGTAECPAVQTPGGTFPGAPLAVCSGSDNGWYTYVPFPTGGGYIVPTAGQPLVVRTTAGAYAKVQFVSYYQGNPVPADIDETSAGRYYTFRYVVSEPGSRSFLTTER